MTDELFNKAKEMQLEINLRSSELAKAKKAFECLGFENKYAKTIIRVSVPADTLTSFNLDPLIYPEAEILLEYIKRLEDYLSVLNSEYLAL